MERNLHITYTYTCTTNDVLMVFRERERGGGNGNPETGKFKIMALAKSIGKKIINQSINKLIKKLEKCRIKEYQCTMVGENSMTEKESRYYVTN